MPSLRRLQPDSPSENASEGTRTRDALILATGAGLVLGGLDGLALATASVLVLAGLALSIPAARRLLPPGTLTIQRGMAAAVALVGLVGFGFFGAEAFVPLAIAKIRDQSATMAGLPLTAGTLCWALGAWIQAREANRRDRRVLVASGFILIAIGVATTDLIFWPEVPVATAIATWGVASLGMGITYSTLSLIILECARPGEEGRASAALQLSNTLCIALGTGLGGVILAAVNAETANLSTSIGLVHLTMVLVLIGSALASTRIPANQGDAQAIAGGPPATTGKSS